MHIFRLATLSDSSALGSDMSAGKDRLVSAGRNGLLSTSGDEP